MITAIGFILAVISLPGTLELLMVTIGALLPYQLPHSTQNKTLRDLYFLIPAHNEELGIEKTLESILKQQTADRILVVADHCTDNTASIARSYGVQVIENQSETVKRGKGAALHVGFQELLGKFNGFIAVIDADSVLADNFTIEVLDKLNDKIQALQVVYRFVDKWKDIRIQLTKIAILAFNKLRPMGRQGLGLSAGLFGNGIILSTNILKAIPYNDSSIVEDLTYHIRLVEAGYRVWFTDQTLIDSDLPTSEKGLEEQRQRWEGGRLGVLLQKGPTILKSIFQGNFRMIEPLLDLLLLPLGFHVLLLCLIALFHFPIFAALSLLVVIFHVLTAMIVGKATLDQWKALCYAPFYILWKITMIGRIWKSSKVDANWVRTDRK